MSTWSLVHYNISRAVAQISCISWYVGSSFFHILRLMVYDIVSGRSKCVELGHVRGSMFLPSGWDNPVHATKGLCYCPKEMLWPSIRADSDRREASRCESDVIWLSTFWVLPSIRLSMRLKGEMSIWPSIKADGDRREASRCESDVTWLSTFWF